MAAGDQFDRKRFEMEQILFYIVAGVTVIATLFAITEKHPVHAIVYLVTSFFSLAVIFFLLAAPLIAMFEVIIYAGAVMVLFLFVVMMLDLGSPEGARRPSLVHCLPALLLSLVTLVSLVFLISQQAAEIAPDEQMGGIKEFAVTLFNSYGVAIEIISLQLLFAVVGALYLGRRRKQ
jgi:NADH-quinone oxidoreductase subunit J